MSLTPMQVRLLTLLDGVTGDGQADSQFILDLDSAQENWKTRESVHQTAGSLSRRGLVIKHPTHGRGSISYSISTAGKNALKEAAKPRSRIKRSKK